MIGCRPLTQQEVAAVAATFDGKMEHRNRLLFWLGITSGFRISELLSLQFRDVWNGGRPAEKVRVRRFFSKGKRVSQSARVAPVVKPLIRRWMMEAWNRWDDIPYAPLFQTNRENRASISRMQAHRVLLKAYNSAQLVGAPGELATHTMRKTYASEMYKHFGDIFAVQQALRHASPASTVAYLSFNDEKIDKAVVTLWKTSETEPNNDTIPAENILNFRR
jgi:integrase/recombinase XerD